MYLQIISAQLSNALHDRPTSPRSFPSLIDIVDDFPNRILRKFLLARRVESLRIPLGQLLPLSNLVHQIRITDEPSPKRHSINLALLNLFKAASAAAATLSSSIAFGVLVQEEISSWLSETDVCHASLLNLASQPRSTRTGKSRWDWNPAASKSYPKD